MKTEAKIYVGTYAKYNNGSIGGDWVNLDDFSNEVDFLSHCKELHEDETEPEFMFQGYEGFPKSFYSESMSEDYLCKLYEYINMDEYDRKLIEMYAEATGYNIDDIDLDNVRDCFHGTAESEADFAEQQATECGEIPDNFPSWICINWERSWYSSLRYDYNTATDEDGTIYFFLNH